MSWYLFGFLTKARPAAASRHRTSMPVLSSAFFSSAVAVSAAVADQDEKPITLVRPTQPNSG